MPTPTAPPAPGCASAITCSTSPLPYSGFDLFNHMADIVTARAKPQAAEAFELLEKDLEKAIKEGTTTTPSPRSTA